MHFPIIKNRSESLESFSNKVFEPALKLANTIQTSTSIYRFSPDIDTDDIFDVRNVTLDNLAVVKMVDIGTGKTLKADSPVEADEKGQIGQQILLLAPALFRCDRGRKPFLLVKAVILVQLYKPLGRRRAVTGVDKQRQGGVSLT